MNDIFLALLVTLSNNNIHLYNKDFQCKLRTFYRGKTDKRLELSVINEKFKQQYIITIFLIGNHNNPRNHYTIKNPHVLNLVHEDNKLIDEDSLSRFINLIIYYANMWTRCIEFDTNDIKTEELPNLVHLERFKLIY